MRNFHALIRYFQRTPGVLRASLNNPPWHSNLVSMYNYNLFTNSPIPQLHTKCAPVTLDAPSASHMHLAFFCHQEFVHAVSSTWSTLWRVFTILVCCCFNMSAQISLLSSRNGTQTKWKYKSLGSCANLLVYLLWKACLVFFPSPAPACVMEKCSFDGWVFLIPTGFGQWKVRTGLEGKGKRCYT